jgi:hypothetical protein
MLEIAETRHRPDRTAEAGDAGKALVEHVMKVMMDGLKEMGIRSDRLVMVGGGPFDERLSAALGADVYCPDASIALGAASATSARFSGRNGVKRSTGS